jgi:molecular chaperone GrpE
VIECLDGYNQADKDQPSEFRDKENQENDEQKNDPHSEGQAAKESSEPVEEARKDFQNTPESPIALSEQETVEDADELAQLKDQLALKEQEVHSYHERLLRLQAEFENFRKRVAKEKIEFSKYATEEVIKSFLPVLDNLERALIAAEQVKDFEGLSKGVEIIAKQFSEAFRKTGLSDIEALNQPFDPIIHQAVARVESTEIPNNTIVEVLQKGYYLHDKVLRPAMVKVAVQPN